MRIVLTGAESSGKSTLTRQLGECFKLPIALEYARIYLEEHGPDYNEETLLNISRLHTAWQKDKIPNGVPLGILDTDLINYKIWFEVVFGNCPQEILNGIEQEAHHVYLLCAPDLPWEPDPLRENPHDRDQLFERHRTEIEKIGRPYKIVRGTEAERLTNAKTALKRLLDEANA